MPVITRALPSGLRATPSKPPGKDARDRGKHPANYSTTTFPVNLQGKVAYWLLPGYYSGP